MAGSARSRCQQHIWFLLRPLSIACRWPSSPCVFTWSFLCVCLCSNLLFYKDTNHTGLGSTLKSSFEFNHFFKDSNSQNGGRGVSQFGLKQILQWHFIVDLMCISCDYLSYIYSLWWTVCSNLLPNFYRVFFLKFFFTALLKYYWHTINCTDLKYTIW